MSEPIGTVWIATDPDDAGLADDECYLFGAEPHLETVMEGRESHEIWSDGSDIFERAIVIVQDVPSPGTKRECALMPVRRAVA